MNELTHTLVPADMHNAIKVFAAVNKMKIPAAYELIIVEGLKTFNFDVPVMKK